MADTDSLLLKSDSDDPSTNVYDVGGDKKKRKRRRSSLASMINMFSKRPSKNDENINNNTNNSNSISRSVDNVSGEIEKMNTNTTTTTTTPFIFSSTGSVLQNNITPVSVAVIDTSSTILVTTVPTLNNLNLDVLQIILNKHLSEVYPQQYTAYELTHMKGDRAVAYLYYVHFMVMHGIDRNPYVFQQLCKIMHHMYMQWSEQIQYVYPLVVNLNGEDPTKEMMNIVNQCVYSVIHFVFNIVLNMRVDDYFADLKQNSAFDATIHPEVFFTAYSDHQQLMGMFNVAINQLRPTLHKHFSNEQTTDYVDLSDTKLRRAPISHTFHVPFQIYKHHHSSLYESEA
ncbi:MAG: hypothetical protein [Betabaculovirus sp.]|nr:MAG: hypothetical protein [Betabaculovirus sp.]